MKYFLFCTYLFLNVLNAQTNDKDLNHLISLFKAELKDYNIGNVEEHYDEGYIKIKQENDYFEENQEVGLSTLYRRCTDKDESGCIEEIRAYLTQFKLMKAERAELNKRLEKFDEIISLLKIRIYAKAQKDDYEKQKAIIRETNESLIEVVVYDLPTAIGSVNKSLLSKWKISSEEAYQIAKSNTISSINKKFTPLHRVCSKPVFTNVLWALEVK